MRVLSIWAPGSEEIEAIAPVDILIRGGLKVTIAGIEKGPFYGSRNIPLMPETELTEVENIIFDCVIIPGGYKGMENLRSNKEVLFILKKHFNAGKLIGALCASPLVLERANILHEITYFTSHPAVADEFSEELKPKRTGRIVEISKNVVTGNGPGAAIPFGLKILELLKGIEIRLKVEESL